MVRVSRYHPVLVALHWFLALLIIAALVLGASVLVRIPNTDPMKIEGLRSHMIGGILILALMLVRLFVRMGSARPNEADAGSPLLNGVAWISHRALYLLVILQAGSGLFMAFQSHLPEIVFMHRGSLPADFWALPIRSVHYLVSRALMVLIAMHIAGAIYHTMVRRDGLLRRMWFGQRVRPTSDPVQTPTQPSTMAQS